MCKDQKAVWRSFGVMPSYLDDVLQQNAAAQSSCDPGGRSYLHDCLQNDPGGRSYLQDCLLHDVAVEDIHVMPR